MDGSTLDKLKIAKHQRVLVLNAPQEFSDALKDSGGTVETALVQDEQFAYIQVFIVSQAEMAEQVPQLCSAVDGDGYLWVCYPKGTSKKYKKTDCNRDTLREAIMLFGFEGVSLISLDDDWSAMRFRNSRFIKK